MRKLKLLIIPFCLFLLFSAESCDEEVPSEDTITEPLKTENPARPEFTTTNDYLYVDVVTVGEYTYNCITNGYDSESMWCDRVSAPASSTTATTRY
jgi:hypothetical protein